MTVTEIKQALGSWELRLRDHTPRNVLDSLTYFGHIAILPGRLAPEQFGDNLLSSARYVGVYRSRDAQNEYHIKGSGMAFWLGDEDDKGDVFELPVTLTSETFANSVNALLPPSGAITAGEIHSVAGTYTGTHQWETPRKALSYVAETFGAEIRVNGDATLDAGTVSQLYVTDPTAILMPKRSGRDLHRAALAGRMSMGTDVADYSTRVVLLAEGEGSSIATGSADATLVPYKDIHGNPVKMTRLVSESGTSSENADVRAQLALNHFSTNRVSIDLSTDAFDIKGDVSVGDYVGVYDPVNGFFDTAREVMWEGQPINPVALRCIEMTWPVPSGWTVAFRDTNGNWIDLSPYYAGETGQTTIKVGDFSRSLTGIGSEPIGTRPNTGGDAVGDDTLPDVPAFTGFSTGIYQPDVDGLTKAVIRAQWEEPLNVDGSTILDGDHYEIRYRVNTIIGYSVDWDTLAEFSWDDLGTWDALVSEPVTESPEWTIVYAAWDTNALSIPELSPGVTYEIQIRAVDGAIPHNFSAWSISQFVDTLGDVIPPGQPAVPVVASSLIGIQVTHNLGRASGGTFNLELDIDHLDVHVDRHDAFFPTEQNKVGELIATSGMIRQGIPAVGSFKIDQVGEIYVRVVVVDQSGNKSNPSEAVTATAKLIDDAYISSLSVSKLTAGTITAQSVLAAEMEVGAGGNIKLTEGSLDVFDGDGGKQIEAGLLSNGEYGLAAINQDGDLTSLNSLIFGMKSKYIDNGFTHGAVYPEWWDFEDILGTEGILQVTLDIGPSGRAIVILSGYVQITDESGSVNPALETYLGFRVSGATTRVPSLADALAVKGEYDADGINLQDVGVRASYATFVEGLNPGSNTFTVAITNTDGESGLVEQGRIIVLPY